MDEVILQLTHDEAFALEGLLDVYQDVGLDEQEEELLESVTFKLSQLLDDLDEE